MNQEINFKTLRNSFYRVKGNGMVIEQLIKQVILRTFEQIKIEAEKNQVCKRKAVGCAILEVNLKEESITHIIAVNGPSGPHNKCSNIVGACGCSHAEPRAIMKYLKRCKKNGHRGKTILLSTYSPCVNCTNITIDSGVIDVFAYEILAEYWNEHPREANAMVERTMPLWTKDQIENDVENKLIKRWLDDKTTR